MNLEKWLHTKAIELRKSGDVPVGARIKILWEKDELYYFGKIIGTEGDKYFRIKYDDDNCEEVS